MRRVRTFFHCLTLPPSLPLVGPSRALDIPPTLGPRPRPGPRWQVGGPSRWSRVDKGRGRSTATACSTFSICPESGAAHYGGVFSVELTSKVWSIRRYKSIYKCSNSADKHVLHVTCRPSVQIITFGFWLTFYKCYPLPLWHSISHLNNRCLHTNIDKCNEVFPTLKPNCRFFVFFGHLPG